MTSLATMAFNDMPGGFGLWMFLSIGAVALFVVFIPLTSWITTTPGHGPLLVGVARHAGNSPPAVPIATSAIMPATLQPGGGSREGRALPR